jgi:hypothetical protein
MIDELGKISNEAIVALSRYYLDTYLEGLRKTMKTRQDRRCPDKILATHLTKINLQRYLQSNLQDILQYHSTLNNFCSWYNAIISKRRCNLQLLNTKIKVVNGGIEI